MHSFPLFKNVEDYFSNLDVYSKVVKNNYMFHSEMYGILKNYIEKELSNKPFKLLDLGSGNAFFMTQVLENSKVESYTAYDLSKESLEEAKTNLDIVKCKKEFLVKDLSKEFLESPALNKYDLIWSSFALHHLSLDDKKRFFKKCFDSLEEEGCFILVDIINEKGSREEWFNVYKSGVYKNWSALTVEDKNYVCDHVYNFDYPESVSVIRDIANEAGFSKQKELFKKDLYLCIEFKR
jgi:cyclopropane fatty-acyl-phospholipid synthase-like methyltransferase